MLLRTFLVVFLAVLVAYTAVVVSREGADFLSVFVGDILQITWAGQFNLDFMGMLVLSALWVAWRHRFSAGGLALAALAGVGGMLFLCIYLLVESARSRGSVAGLLMGSRQGDR